MASESDIPSTVTEAAGQGIRLGSAAEGYLIENVIPGSRAERASLKTGDRLLEVGGRQYGDLEAVRKILSDTSQETVFIVVQRGERKLGVFLR
jgi:S1-C subfamily serine protease